MTTIQPSCVVCGRTDAEVPLVALRAQGKDAWICSQHLPILIHKPHMLVGKMPGAENLAAEGHEQ
ncbi:MAG: hypothetical protein GXP37_15780 [Chloroflexi bacterium]|nr:hypothetical protein [Chloroflexota bacterium]